jgi:hypothetical protein
MDGSVSLSHQSTPMKVKDIVIEAERLPVTHSQRFGDRLLAEGFESFASSLPLP